MLLFLLSAFFFFFFKQKTAYEMRISDWSSDVCSSDLAFSSRRKKGSSPCQLHPASPVIRPQSSKTVRDPRWNPIALIRLDPPSPLPRGCAMLRPPSPA